MLKLLVIAAIVLAVITGAATTIYRVVRDNAQTAACNQAAAYHRDHPDFKGKLANDIACGREPQ